MTKQQAMWEAHRIAYERLEQAYNDMDALAGCAGDGWSVADKLRVEKALDELAQRHFNAARSEA